MRKLEDKSAGTTLKVTSKRKSAGSAGRSPSPGTIAATALIIPIVVLASGHMLSNLLRTLPAVGVDVISFDLGVTAEGLASLTGAYHFAFAAGQIPVGVALDRFGVRNVSLSLLAAAVVGAVLAAMSDGVTSFLISQLTLGLATSGMLLCPMTLAARHLPAAKFGLWSGIVLALGNSGMLLSASPLAWLVENYSWRAGFWSSALLGIIIAGLVALLVPNDRPSAGRMPAIFREMKAVVALGLSRALRGMVLLAFVSLAVALILRGLWGGPWLMEEKGLSRIEAGDMLLLFTISLILGPVVAGVLDRWLGHRRALIAAGQMLGVLALLGVAAGASGGFVSGIFGVNRMPASYDVTLFIVLGTAVSAQSLLYAMARRVVAVENTGKALSAINLAFFLGTAVLQAASGPVASAWGMPAVFVFLAILLALAVAGFLALTRNEENPRSDTGGQSQ